MASSFVRGKHVICKVEGRHDARIVEDGAVYQRDGVIVDVGPYSALARKYDADETLGSPDHLVCPGFVNCHHHVGLTAFQMGTPDMALELWIAHRARKRDADLYLDTLYLAFEMIESGITTIQHLHSRANHCACRSSLTRSSAGRSPRGSSRTSASSMRTRVTLEEREGAPFYYMNSR